MGPARKEASGTKKAAPASLVSFLAFNCLAGVIAGWTMLGGLLWLDVNGLGGLVMASDLFPMPLLMLLAAFAITFGAVAMGSAIMGLGRGDGSAGVTGRGLLRSASSDAGRIPGLTEQSCAGLDPATAPGRQGANAAIRQPLGSCPCADAMLHKPSHDRSEAS